MTFCKMLRKYCMQYNFLTIKTYLVNVSKFSFIFTLFWYRAIPSCFGKIPFSMIAFVLKSIKFPVHRSTENPTKVIVLRSGLKKRYGCGLKYHSKSWKITVQTKCMTKLYVTYIMVSRDRLWRTFFLIKRAN